MGFIDTLLETAGSGIASTGMGLLLEGHNDARQIRQQQKLQDMQISGQKELTDYNMAKQLQMWKDTSYGAQKEQLEKAGLNPGLMYGMGGGGGQSTGQTGSNVSGGNAPQGGREIAEMMGMGMQMQLLKAQKENIEADTKNKEADTANKPIQGANIGYQNALLIGQKELQNLDLKVNEQTLWERINEIVSRSIEQQEKGITAGVERYINQETQFAEIEKIKSEALSAAVEKRLLDEKVELTKAQIKEIAESLKQGWEGLRISNEQVKLNRLLAEFNTDWSNIIGKEAVEAIGGLIKVLPFAKILKGTRPPEIKGFGGKKAY
ncbi:MAG: DNA pilot protein [Microviridae sp.]|nr:MAG: DNA pilot protein [Microviridae sp.]